MVIDTQAFTLSEPRAYPTTNVNLHIHPKSGPRPQVFTLLEPRAYPTKNVSLHIFPNYGHRHPSMYLLGAVGML